MTIDDLCASAGTTKSSFYHFFSSKQELLLTALDNQWQWFTDNVLSPAFSPELSPQQQILRFFDLALQGQQMQKQTSGHMHGCPLGNLTLEMSTQDEIVRTRVEHFFQQWLHYFERMLDAAKAQGTVPPTLDTITTAQSLLAYFEGVLLLAKGRNDPTLIAILRTGVLSLMHYQTQAILVTGYNGHDEEILRTTSVINP